MLPGSLLSDNQRLSVANPFAVIDDRNIFAGGPHQRRLRIVRKPEIPKVRMTLCEKAPGPVPFDRVFDFSGMAAGKDGLDVAQRTSVTANGDRHPIVEGDVGELLAGSEDHEIDRPSVVGVTDNGCLRPSIRPNGRDRQLSV